MTDDYFGIGYSKTGGRMVEVRRMYFSVDGGQVVLQWPINIKGECLEEAVEAINMQINSIRRAIGERERAAALAPEE